MKKSNKFEESANRLAKQTAKEKYERKEWYTIRSLLGHQWWN